jgi:outer membrane protein assembly factor BamB
MLDGGTVYCLKANTPNSGGEIIWHQRHPHVVKGKLQGKALLKEKRLYIPCKGGKILCLDAATGQAVPGWIGQTEMEIDWLLESSQDLIAVSKETGSLFLVDPLRGRQDGQAMHLNFRITSEPVVWKENVFLCNDKGQLIKVNLRQRQSQKFAEGFNKICASPIIHDNGLFAGAHDHHIYAWDVNGSLKWRSNFCTDHAISSSPAIANDMLAIGANDGKAYGLSLDTGERMWTFDPGLGNAFVRDVLFHDGIFYLGMAQSNKPSGFLYALPWHLGEYEDIASRFTAKGKNLEAANLFAVAAHYASRNRDELSEKAANCWIEGGSPRLAVEYWLGLAKPKKAAQCWIIAAEDRRGRDNLQAAEYYYEASRLFWRLGDTQNEDRCYHEAVELGKWPRLRLKVINNPMQTIGKQGSLTVRVENIGYSQAVITHWI